MNFYDLNQNLPPQLPPPINNQLPVDINYKINEIENNKEEKVKEKDNIEYIK